MVRLITAIWAWLRGVRVETKSENASVHGLVAHGLGDGADWDALEKRIDAWEETVPPPEERRNAELEQAVADWMRRGCACERCVEKRKELS